MRPLVLAALVITLGGLPSLHGAQAAPLPAWGGSPGGVTLAQPTPPAPVTVDQTITLDAADQRITAQQWRGATVVETGDPTSGDLYLRAGIAIAAEGINAHLHNVQGQVRLTGTLDRLLERLRAHQAPAPPAPSAEPPP